MFPSEAPHACHTSHPHEGESLGNCVSSPPAFCSSAMWVFEHILLKIKKKSVTWCLLMTCKLALQMEIFIFQFI